MRAWLSTCCAISLTAAGCSSARPTDAGPGDAASDATESDDGAGDDGAGDVGAGDATPSDAQACASIDAYCATAVSAPGSVGGRCVRNWSAAETPAAWCPTDLRTYVFPDCNGFDVVVQGAIDTSYTYVYDRNSGNLAGIWFGSPLGWSCIAGDAPPVNADSCGDAGTPPPLTCPTGAGAG
jgi:hypothetical protein